MQKLIIITGSPWTGKTTVADLLLESLENCAHLDGDWVWRVNPFSVQDPRLRNGDKNISFVLSTYLQCNFDYVIFSSILGIFPHIREGILKGITAQNFNIIGFTLTCSEQTLTERHKKRGDAGEVDFQWLRREPHPNDFIINTDNKTPSEIADEIKHIVTE